MTQSDHAPWARLLLADDNDEFRRDLAKLLTGQGYECNEARDAESVLDALKTGNFDALITDLHLRGSAGLEMIKTVSALVPGLPIVILTGQPTVETAIRAVGLPVIAYLIKPPPVDELLTVLRGSVVSCRRLRWVDESCARLRQWESKLSTLAETLRRPRQFGEAQPLTDHFQLTLQHVMLELGTLDQSIAAWRREARHQDGRREAELAGAIRHTIGVLEQTKQNFKSQRLADLRRQLADLLEA